MADVVASTYKRDPHPRVKKWGERIARCAQHLTFSYDPLPKSTRYKRQLVRAELCRVRTCPICSWRRAEKLAAEVGQAVQKACAGGELVPLMLTLTVRNVHVSKLKKMLTAMLKAWSLLRRRKGFSDLITHWTRSIEITRGRGHIKGDSHPHLHCLLLAEPEEAVELMSLSWSKLWQDVMRLDYEPVTHIMPLDVGAYGVAEALKYTVKPHGMVQHAISGWLASVALAIDGVRVFACSEGLRVKDKALNDEDASNGHAEVDDVPQGVPVPPKRGPVSVVYGWTGVYYRRTSVMIGMGAAEVRQMALAAACAARSRGSG